MLKSGQFVIKILVQMRLDAPKSLIITLKAAHHQGAFKRRHD
jgi:hypothetical protein